jgi:hypothetical protein
MTIIRYKVDFEKFYTYDLKYLKKSDYPKCYPCLGEVVEWGGGIGGSFRHHRLTKIPRDVDEASWIKGYTAAVKNRL